MCYYCLGVYWRPGIYWRPMFIRDSVFIRRWTSKPPAFIRDPAFNRSLTVFTRGIKSVCRPQCISLSGVCSSIRMALSFYVFLSVMQLDFFEPHVYLACSWYGHCLWPTLFAADIVGSNMICGRHDLHPRYQQQFRMKSIYETDEFGAEKSKVGFTKWIRKLIAETWWMMHIKIPPPVTDVKKWRSTHTIG